MSENLKKNNIKNALFIEEKTFINIYYNYANKTEDAEWYVFI